MAKEDKFGEYSSEHFQVLRNADHIRQRPGMYIGDTGAHGLHHLVYELIYNAVDEAQAGYCKNIVVKAHADESCSVGDDGRGIPAEMHAGEGRPVLEVVMTSTGTSGKFDRGAYKVSLGLHGMGLKAVNALSERTEAVVQRGGRTYRQEYERGKATTGIKDIGASERTGTTIHFWPDPQIFHDAKLVFEMLESRCRELCFLNKGLAMRLVDERSGKEQQFKYDGGLADLLTWHTQNLTPVCAPITGDIETEEGRASIAFAWYEDAGESIRCYCNCGYVLRGEHLRGIRSARTRHAVDLGPRLPALRDALAGRVTFADVARMGFVAVISFELADPMYGAPTRDLLNNTEAFRLSVALVRQCLERFAQERPDDARAVEAFLIAAHIDPKTGAPNVLV